MPEGSVEKLRVGTMIVHIAVMEVSGQSFGTYMYNPVPKHYIVKGPPSSVRIVELAD